MYLYLDDSTKLRQAYVFQEEKIALGKFPTELVGMRVQHVADLFKAEI